MESHVLFGGRHRPDVASAPSQRLLGRVCFRSEAAPPAVGTTGETEPGPKCDALAEQWFAAYSDGVMNGIIETLTSGYLDLQPNDIAAHNGQVVALELIRR